MIVIGIDPAQDGFHAVALMRNAEGEVFMETFREVEKINKKIPPLRCSVLYRVSDRAYRMLGAVRGMWNDSDEDNSMYVFIEEPFAGPRNLRTALKLAQTVGAIAAGVGEYTVRVYLASIPKWKEATSGAGNASKTQIADWLNHTHPNYAAHCDGSQDLIDACCISLYGLGVIADAELVRTVGGAGQL